MRDYMSDSSFEPRDYQTKAVDALRAELASGKRRIILYAPTGAGKTECCMMIIKSALAKKKRVAFLCNRINLVNQTSDRFWKSNIRHGIIQGQNTIRTYENVMVISIQTAARRGMPDFDMIFIDEAHACGGSKEYRSVIEKFKGPVLGATATPFARSMGKHYDSLGGPLFESIVVAATVQELIDQGFLVDVEVYAPSEPDLSKVKITAGDYNEKQLGVAVDKADLIGDIVTNWKKLANGTPTVCFATNIAHSKHIVEQFIAAGIAAEHLDHRSSDDERKATLKRVESGVTTVISNVGILAEGWDFPACKTLILARPTKSLVRHIQMIGRVLRPHEGKPIATVLDHGGSVQRLGFPTDDFPMTLDDGKSKESKPAKAKEKLPKLCPSCKYLKPIGVHVCPKCGFVPEQQSAVIVEDGELVKIGRGKKKMTTDDKAQLYGELKSIASRRGWSSGRLSNVFRDIAGTWPNAYRNEQMREPEPATLAMVQFLNIRFAKRQKKDSHAS